MASQKVRLKNTLLLAYRNFCLAIPEIFCERIKD